jgi:aminoglycoside phosphotransferase (APT) family kinase protein
VEWTDSERAGNAAILGLFLAELHGIPVDDGVRDWAPGDILRRADLPFRAPMIEDLLGKIGLPDERRAQLLDLVGSLTETPVWRGLTCWLHGDLYARHLIVDEARRVNGVIDWGDVHVGDPAEDISIAVSFLPEYARNDFRAAYGPIDDATWDRARFRAIFYGATLIHYGQEIGDREIASAGFHALNNVAA